MDVQTRIGMPLDEFIRAWETSPFELVNGHVIPHLPRVAIHAVVQTNLFRVLLEQCGSRGEVNIGGGFISVDEHDRVIEAYDPAVSFYSSVRWQAYTQITPNWLDKPLMFAPDVAALIVGRDDRFEDVDVVSEGYLRQGVKLLWIIKAQSHEINVLTGNLLQRLTATDLLTGGDVLPGFNVPVADVFPKA